MLPSDSYKWRTVENAAHKVARLYNAKQIRTPVFESADLYLRSVGESSDIVNKEMYVFEDKGGRKMALRPEGTAGVARSFIENNLGETLPLKTYYIESIYRYEQPQAGRYREHHQFGVEFFGSELADFDVEVISMAHDFLHSLGFGESEDFGLEINSIGCPQCRKGYNAALRAFLDSVKGDICDDCKRRAVTNPLRALDCKNPHCRSIYAAAPKISDFLCDDCKAHMSAVLDGLDAKGIKYRVNTELVRGLDYYTRTVFEFVSGPLTVLGGGRYDGLVEELGGKHMPCVGFGSGIERLIEAIDARGGSSFVKPCPDVFVAAQCDAARGKCREIVNELRANGISAETDLMGKSLKAQFKYADRQNYKYVVTVGESEIDSGVYGMKRMSDGQTSEIRDDDIARDIGRILWQK